MRGGFLARLGLFTAIVVTVVLAGAGPVAAGGCGQWGATGGNRVGDTVTARSGPPFGGTVVDVRLGSTIVVTAPLIGGGFEVTFTIPSGTPAGATTIAVRTRVSAPFTPSVACDWQALPFTVEPSFVLPSPTTTAPPAPTPTTSTTAAPVQSSTTSTTAAASEEEGSVTTTTSTSTTTTSAVIVTTTASIDTTAVVAAPFDEASGSAGLPSIVVALLGAVGGAALFAGGMLFERKATKRS